MPILYYVNAPKTVANLSMLSRIFYGTQYFEFISGKCYFTLPVLTRSASRWLHLPTSGICDISFASDNDVAKEHIHVRIGFSGSDLNCVAKCQISK